MKSFSYLSLTIGFLILFSCRETPNAALQNKQKPNIVLIMSDDMGFSDLGCYGGEVQTPNLDELAKNGIRYSQFYNAARCCPTRASLLTGVYPHQAGMGWMTNANLGTPQYQGDLKKNTPTIAEILKKTGYMTYMTGKWHLSSTRKDDAGIIDNWPAQRGFDRFFGIVGGAGNYFKLPVYSNNEKYKPPKDFIFTKAVSDSSVAFINRHFKKLDTKPMFMYVAYTAPHWPLHALDENIAKYQGKYSEGWDELRKQRLKKQYEIGLWSVETRLTKRDEKVPEWNLLTRNEKLDFERRMEIYAAQIDEMDQGIGKIVNALKKQGQLENTVIFFLNDNGACAEYISSGKSKDLKSDLIDTFESYRKNWANASNTPFREYKHWIHEGGIRTPLIVHWPSGIDNSLSNGFIRDYGHITDIMATCVELSGAKFPEQYMDNSTIPLQGKSLAPHFTKNKNDRGPIFWEHEANIGMRDGDWKLVAKTLENNIFDQGNLELYNIENDPTELEDLSKKHPDKLGVMFEAWKEWADYVGVYPLDSREYNVRSRESKRNINGEFDMDFGD